MKKSLHLTHTDIASDSRILKEIGSLAEAGYAVSGIGVVLDEGASQSTPHHTADISSIHLRSRKMTLLPKTLRHALSLLELLAKMLPRAIWRRPDIVHCHDTLVLPIGCIVKIFTGARLVYDAHELESDRNGLSSVQRWLTLRAEKLLWRFVDALIVVSPSIQDWYQKHIGPKPSAVVLNSPLFPDKTADGEIISLRKKFAIPSNRKIFIYVGILGRGRGIDLIVQAFTDPETTGHVVFLGYGELLGELKNAAANYPNIHVHNAVPHADVVSIVQSADYGLCLVENVSLSDYYCLPNKLFEYCFAGVPVLASDFPDIRSVVTSYAIGDCCSLDAREIKRAVEELQSSERRFTFKDLTPLSWEAQGKSLVRLYQQVTSS